MVCGCRTILRLQHNHTKSRTWHKFCSQPSIFLTPHLLVGDKGAYYVLIYSVLWCLFLAPEATSSLNVGVIHTYMYSNRTGEGDIDTLSRHRYCKWIHKIHYNIISLSDQGLQIPYTCIYEISPHVFCQKSAFFLSEL